MDLQRHWLPKSICCLVSAANWKFNWCCLIGDYATYHRFLQVLKLFLNAIFKYFGSISVLIWSTHETKLLFPRNDQLNGDLYDRQEFIMLWLPILCWSLPGSQKDFFVFSYVWINLPVLWSFKKSQTQKPKQQQKNPIPKPSFFCKTDFWSCTAIPSVCHLQKFSHEHLEHW